jgi:predicted lipid-binding transport protein (Tim44 family)
LPQDATLSRDNWEHVAGTRFVDGVLKPLMEEYLSYLAAFLAGLVVLANVLFFLVMRRARRIGTPKPDKGAKAAAPAAAQTAPPGPAPQKAAPPATQPAPAESPPAGPGEGAAPPPAESPEQGAGKSGEKPARSEQDVEPRVGGEQDASGTPRPRSRRSWWRRRA